MNATKGARSFLARWQLYLMLLLPLAYLIIFAYVPMFGAQIAFRKFTALGGIWNSPWVGLHYFRKFFQSYQFGRVLPNTLILSGYQLLAGFPIPILFALMLNSLQSQAYKKTIQMVTYIPHFISMVVLVGIILRIFNPLVGLFGQLYTGLTGAPAPDLLASPNAFRHIYVWSGVWQNTGWGTIIYMAALAGVDKELHEAAMVDGATRFKRVLHIDVPSILPTITIVLILNCGQIMNIGFEKAFLLQNPLNQRASEVISTYVYKVGLVDAGGDFSYAAAIGLFNSVVNFALIVVANLVSRKVSQTSLW